MQSVPRATSFDELYGETIRKAGISAVPAALSRYQGKLGLTFAEVGVLVALFSYKWSIDAPFPSIRTLAQESGVPRSSIHDLLVGIADKGLLKIEHRVTQDGFKTSNAYHLEPLLGRLIELIEADGHAESVRAARAKRHSPGRTVSGRPDTVAGSSRHPWPACPASVAGPDRPEVDSVEIDSMEVEDVSPSAKSIETAEPERPAPQPPTAAPPPTELLPTIRHLARRVANAARRSGWHRQLAGDLADYLVRHPLTAAQLERLVRMVEAHGPLRTEAEFWERLDLYRATYAQPKAQPATDIVPGGPPVAPVGRPLENGRRR